MPRDWCTVHISPSPLSKLGLASEHWLLHYLTFKVHSSQLSIFSPFYWCSTGQMGSGHIKSLLSIFLLISNSSINWTFNPILYQSPLQTHGEWACLSRLTSKSWDFYFELHSIFVHQFLQYSGAVVNAWHLWLQLHFHVGKSCMPLVRRLFSAIHSRGSRIVHVRTASCTGYISHVTKCR